jgi:hypothetical protein
MCVCVPVHMFVCIHGCVCLYLFYDGPSEWCVWAVQDLSQQHGLEEGPGYGSPSGVHHVQVEVHAERSWPGEEKVQVIRCVSPAFL